MQIQMDNIQWDVAEVLEYDYTYSYIFPDEGKTNVDNLFALKVKSSSTLFNNKTFLSIIRKFNLIIIS